MGDALAMSTCPNCGAPHSVPNDASRVVCIYCNVSLTVQRQGQAAAQLTRDSTIAEKDIEQVKQLLLDGKKPEAVALYASAAKVDAAEAERIVNAMFLDAYWTLTRHLPINAFGVVMYLVIIGGAAGLAYLAAQRALLLSAPPWWVLSALLALLSLHQLRSFVRHLSATMVLSFGAKGRGKVLRCVTMRDMKPGIIVVVQFEVTPDDGSAVFVDQETLNVGEQTLKKLTPGSSILVRFDASRQHVYPTMPVTVVGVSP